MKQENEPDRPHQSANLSADFQHQFRQAENTSLAQPCAQNICHVSPANPREGMLLGVYRRPTIHYTPSSNPSRDPRNTKTTHSRDMRDQKTCGGTRPKALRQQEEKRPLFAPESCSAPAWINHRWKSVFSPFVFCGTAVCWHVVCWHVVPFPCLHKRDSEVAESSLFDLCIDTARRT